MLSFKPALNRRHDLTNANLKDEGALVQAMRWFAHRSGVLLAVDAHHSTLVTELQREVRLASLTPNAEFVLKLVYWQNLILNLRALLDPNPSSLGIGCIAANLATPDTRNRLCEYLDRHEHGRKMRDASIRDQYLDYILKYSQILATQGTVPIADDAHPLVEKVALVRRVANKLVAHTTLDGYKLYGSDLHDVTVAVIVIACAIEQVMGDAAIDTDMRELERAAWAGAGTLLRVDTDTEPHMVDMIRILLPKWVSFGIEFPEWPLERPASP